MKRFFALCVALGFGIVMGWLFEASPGKVDAAGRGGGGPAGNGDVNGDGLYDVSDAVYLLTWQFLGGPAPVAIDCPPAGRVLPDTGQSSCYGLDEQQGWWKEVPCAEAPCPGQDGAYATGCGMDGRFVSKGDGTVTDNCTGLMWQQDWADVTGNDESGSEDSIPWCEAMAYCENLNFAGYDDWRLPNVRELESIVDYGTTHHDYAIVPGFGIEPGSYWSSTTVIGDLDVLCEAGGVAWAIDFFDGELLGSCKKLPLYVRAVRTAR